MTAHHRPAAYTTPAQIARYHDAAEVFAPSRWPDLPHPHAVTFTAKWVNDQLERHMAEVAERQQREAAPPPPKPTAQMIHVRRRLDRIEMAAEIVAQHPGIKVAEIARIIGVSGKPAGEYVLTLQAQGRVIASMWNGVWPLDGTAIPMDVRRAIIVQKVDERPMSREELRMMLRVTPRTIMRDLQWLVKNGRITATTGKVAHTRFAVPIYSTARSAQEAAE